MIYPWQYDDWQRFNALRGKWPQAVLLEGPAGIGKVHFAQALAQAILCEAPLEQGYACGTCKACLWMAQGHHPDYRLLVPEHLMEAQQSADQSANTRAKAKTPSTKKAHSPENKASSSASAVATTSSDTSKKTAAPSQEIKIASVRDLQNICTVTAHRAGWRVIVLHPAEALNLPAANALLKTLEEPAEKIIFILITARLDRVLPTIISRCRRYAMHIPSASQALHWLSTQGLTDQQTQAALAWAGGAPLTALAYTQQKEEDKAASRILIEQLCAGARCDTMVCAEALQKIPIAHFISMLQRWLYDLGTWHLARRSHYFPEHIDALAACAKHLNIARWAQYVRVIYAQRAVENHPLNARLRIEDALAPYPTLFI